ncbi:MAG: hypothetical protein WCW02_00145 [Candidatus Buchananbacteria bacterium]
MLIYLFGEFTNTCLLSEVKQTSGQPYFWTKMVLLAEKLIKDNQIKLVALVAPVEAEKKDISFLKEIFSGKIYIFTADESLTAWVKKIDCEVISANWENKSPEDVASKIWPLIKPTV